MVQVTWLINSTNNESRKFNHSVHVALFEVYKKLAGTGNISVKNPVHQITEDFYVVDLNRDINAGVLEFYLVNEFDKLNIHTDFEYGIYDCNTDKIIYGGYIINKETHIDAPAVKALPKIADLTYYFVVRFPRRAAFIFNSIRIWMFFAAVSVIVLIFFGYALFIILRQKRLSDLQRDFINNMTHEFKTPLSSIRIAADYLHSQEGIQKDGRYRKYIEIIISQNQHLNNQVENVLQLAKSEKKSFSLNKSKVDLAALIEKIVNGMQANLKDKGRINFINTAGPVLIYLDELHITNIITSLLDNSIKYCSKEPDIEIVLERTGCFYQLKVTDNGIGIPTEHRSRVFEKFFRVPTGNIHNVKGFGLGLYYVKKICKSHGWKIAVSDAIAEGTQIIIQIPTNL